MRLPSYQSLRDLAELLKSCKSKKEAEQKLKDMPGLSFLRLSAEYRALSDA